MPKQREWWAAWFTDKGWVIDTCAGGAFTGPRPRTDDDAKLWRSPNDALVELEATDMIAGLTIGKDYEIVPMYR